MRVAVAALRTADTLEIGWPAMRMVHRSLPSPRRILAVVAVVTALLVGVGMSSGDTARAEPPSAIAGQVLSWMDPIGYVKVTVFDAATGAALRSGWTDGEGNYLIGGLPATAVQVRATKAGYLDAWASGASSRVGADVYTLVAGETLRQTWDADMVLYLDLAPESVVTGSVMGFNDWIVSPWDDPLPGVKVTVYSAATGAALGAATTDSFGVFRIGKLPSGDVKVRAAKAGWLTTWAMGHSTRATADVFTLQPFQPIDLGMLTMYAPAAIEGQVLSAMDPIVGDVTITVFDAVSGAAVGSGVSDAAGYYRVDQLPPGSIKVRASKPGYITNWANSFGHVTRDTATVFTLVPGQVLAQTWSPEANLYLDIQPEAVVEGQVLGNGEPLAGAKVTVVDVTSGRAVRSVIADADGRYRIDRIDAAGGLTVTVKASKPGWRPGWANDRTSRADADTFFLYPGAILQQSWDPPVLSLDLVPIS